MEKGQRRIGFPDLGIIRNWLNHKTHAEYPSQKQLVMPKLKNPELEKLDCYKGEASDSFWRKFPTSGESENKSQCFSLEKECAKVET